MEKLETRLINTNGLTYERTEVRRNVEKVRLILYKRPNAPRTINVTTVISRERTTI